MKRKSEENSELEPNKESEQEVDPQIVTSWGAEKLFELIKADDVEGVRRITDSGNFDFNVTDDEGYSPIHIAARTGAAGVLRYFIKTQGATALALQTHRIYNKVTPLWIAADRGHVEVVKVLLEHGVNTEAFSSRDYITPLWAAANEGHIEVVKVLLEGGAEVHAVDMPGQFSDQQILDLINITKAIRNTCKLKDKMPGDFQDSGYNRDFFLRVFKNTLAKKGLPCDSYDEFKDKLTKLYTGKVSDSLLGALIKEVGEYEKCAVEEIKTIEGVLFSYLHDISPMPYSETPKEQGLEVEFDPSKATPKAITEHVMYHEFWNNPDNAKYKTPGTKLMELMTITSTTHLIALTDLIIRALVMADDDSTYGRKTNILEPVNKGVLALNQKMVLGKNIKQALTKVMHEYNKYKDKPSMKTLIVHDNKIETHEEELLALKEVQKAQDHKISEQAHKLQRLESFIDKMSKHLGIDFGVSNNNSDTGIHDVPMNISGSHHDSAVYHVEFNS